MKLNNKGFAITTALYGSMVLFLLLSAATLGMLGTEVMRENLIISDTIEIVNPEKYKLVFDGNGGTSFYEVIDVKSDGKANVPSYEAAKIYRDSGTLDGGYLYGYNFKGWSTKPEGNAEYCAGETISNFFDKYDHASNTLTLYAVWERVNPKLQITAGTDGYALYTHTKDGNGNTITDGLTNGKYKCWTYNNPNYVASRNFLRVATKSFSGTYDLLWLNTSNHCAQINYTAGGYNPVIINNENSVTKKIKKISSSDIGKYSCGK